MFKAVLFDLSGVLYTGEAAIPGAIEAIARIQASPLEIRFITNTSRRTSQQLLTDLRQLGFELAEAQLFTATDAAKQWLLAQQLRPYCLVHRDILSELDDLPQNDPNAVLIGDAADDFTYNNLNRAFQLCQSGAPLIGIGYNRYFKQGDALLLDAGPFVRAIEFAASVEAIILGKPSADFFAQVLASTGATAEQTLMIGDDVFGDVEGALHSGLSGCLVRTGKYQPGDENKIDGAFELCDSVVEAVEWVLRRAA